MFMLLTLAIFLLLIYFCCQSYREHENATLPIAFLQYGKIGKVNFFSTLAGKNSGLSSSAVLINVYGYLYGLWILPWEWSFWLHKDNWVTVVHPLGGCPIRTDSETSTVDRDGRVFKGSASNATEVHEGLYVVYTSSITITLGVNHTFAIVTNAVRCLRKRFDWTLPNSQARTEGEL